MITFKSYPPRSGEDVAFSPGTEVIIGSLDSDLPQERYRMLRVGEAIGLILHTNMASPTDFAIREMASVLTEHWDGDDFNQAFHEGVERGIRNAAEGATSIRFRAFPPRGSEGVEFGDGHRVDFVTSWGILDSEDVNAYTTAEAMGRLLHANMEDPTDATIQQIGEDLAARWEGEPLPADFRDQLMQGAQNERAYGVRDSGY